jgi:hypothetical protein
MIETLDLFIIRRSRELDEAAAPLRQQLAEIEEERDKLNRAARAIGAEGVAAAVVEVVPAEGAPTDQPPQPHEPEPQQAVITRSQRRPNRVSTKTMKAAIETILRDFPNGLTALEILPKLNEMLGTDYPRTSLSPQLSRLKTDKLVTLDGSIWKSGPPVTGADVLGETAPGGDFMS